jgi:hypothetical protein
MQCKEFKWIRNKISLVTDELTGIDTYLTSINENCGYNNGGIRHGIFD